MKRFLVSILDEDGSAELHPMKEWLRAELGERQWVKRLIPELQERITRRDASLEIIDGFMLSWVGRVPTKHESSVFIDALLDEVKASRTLEEIIFDSRSSARARYTLLRRPLVVG